MTNTHTMNNEQIMAVFTALIIGMIVSLVWTLLAYRKKYKHKPKEQRDDVTLHVRLGAKPEQAEPTHEELLQTRVEQLSKQLEQATTRANNNEAIAENHKIAKDHVMDELDDAHLTIQTLREALDRAFKVIAEQNEQIKQLGDIQLGEGWDEVKPLRSVTSLTPDEAIVCNDERELMAVLQAFEDAGVVWFSGDKPTQWKPEYGWEFPERIEFSGGSIIRGVAKYPSELPASDFVVIPTEETRPDNSEPGEQAQPAEQPEAVEFKVGDWLRGERVFKKGEEAEGEVYKFFADDDIAVKTNDGNNRALIRSTCRHVPRPEQQQPEPAEPAIDWSKPVAFPEGNVVPEGVKVSVVSESRSVKDSYYRPIGMKGITTETSSLPFCNWEDGKSRIPMNSHELAPLDPRDHPLHPEFYGKGGGNA